MTSKSPTKSAPESATGSTTMNAGADQSAATFMAMIEIDQDDENDLRRMILDDYEKCLEKHDANLQDLLRLHRRETSATKKLAVKLDQAVRKEKKEREKFEKLNNAVDQIVQGAKEMTQQPVPKLADKADELRLAIDAIKRKIDDYRREAENLDKQIEDTRNEIARRKAQTGELWVLPAGIQDQPQQPKSRVVVEEDARAEIKAMLKGLNECLAQMNRRMQTNYAQVNENPDSPVEVREVLDKLLADSSEMMAEYRRLLAEIGDLKRQIADQEQHVERARRQLDFFNQDAKRLLAVGGGLTATDGGLKPEIFTSPDRPVDYEMVDEHVQRTFRTLIEKLKQQKKDLADLSEAKVKMEQDDKARKANLDREIAAKQAKIDDARDELYRLSAKNDAMRAQLARPPIVKASAAEAGADEGEEEVMRALKQTQESMTKSGVDPAAMEKQLERTQAQHEALKKEFDKLAAEINDAEDQLARKRRELEDLNENAERERSIDRQHIADLERKIIETRADIENLERELADVKAKLLKSDNVKKEIEKLIRLEKDLNDKLNDMNNKVWNLEDERDNLNDVLRKQNDACDDLRGRLKAEDTKRQLLEDRLQDMRQKEMETERRLEREKQRTFIIERDMGAIGPGTAAMGRKSTVSYNMEAMH